MLTVVIICGGPPKPRRNRHLEIMRPNAPPLISDVINNCRSDTNEPPVKVSVVISHDNTQLKNYVKKTHPDVHIIETPDYKMKTTLELGFNQDDNDKLLVKGDLINLKRDNVQKFVNTKHRLLSSTN